jgi:hypothetical protein
MLLHKDEFESAAIEHETNSTMWSTFPLLSPVDLLLPLPQPLIIPFLLPSLGFRCFQEV